MPQFGTGDDTVSLFASQGDGAGYQEPLSWYFSWRETSDAN